MLRYLLVFIALATHVLVFGSQSKIDSLNKVVERTTNDSIKCELYMTIAFLHYTGEPAVNTAHLALDLAKKLGNEKLIAKSYNCLAWCYDFQRTNIKTAYLDSALLLFLRLNDNEGMGSVYNTRASILLEYGSNIEAQGSLEKAYAYFGKSGNKHRQAVVLNNWAVTLLDEEKPKEAFEKYSIALNFRLTESPINDTEIARVYYGLGRCAAMLEQPTEAIEYFLLAYKHRKEIRSYGVAEVLIEMCVMVCDLALAEKDTTAVVNLLSQKGFPNGMAPLDTALLALSTAGRHQFGYSILDLRRKRAIIHKDFERAYQLLEEQKRLDEEIKLSDSSLGALANLKSQYKQEQLKIQLLQEELENRKSSSQVKFLLIFLGIMLLVLIIGLLVYQNRLKAKHLELTTYKQQQQFTTMSAMLEGQEKERARIARDLHDGLGNLLSTVKVTVGSLGLKSNGQGGDELYQSANMLIDEACKEVRKISHEMMPQALERLGLNRALEDMVLTTDQAHGFSANFYVYGEEKKIEDATEMMLFRIAQELLNNIIKYAKASEVNVQLTYGKDWLNLTVEDDGIGFDVDGVKAKSGMGLKSIAFRTAHIGGQCEIESKPGRGTMASINLPLTKTKSKVL